MPRIRKQERLGLGTRCVHGPDESGGGSGPAGETARRGRAITLPIEQTTTYRFRDPQEMLDVFEGKTPGYQYSRYGNPTVNAVERKLAVLEGTEAGLLFSSGMAAISTILLHLCRAGDRVAAQRDLYGGSQSVLSQWLPRYGIEVETVDVEDAASLRAALARHPRVFYFETPTNPLLRISDGPALCRLARRAGVPTVVDSTFATPILQRPREWGADLVVHSGTKYLGGHSDLTCGVLLGERATIDAVALTRRMLGAVPDAWQAFLLDRGLKTLEVRVERQCASALELARRLSGHASVRAVHYPGLALHPQHERALRLMPHGAGGVFSFEVRGGRKGALRCMGGFRLIALASSLGGPETLVSHPATTSHIGLSARERRSQGIGDGLLRLAVGLESVEDLWADLEQGLNEV